MFILLPPQHLQNYFCYNQYQNIPNTTKHKHPYYFDHSLKKNVFFFLDMNFSSSISLTLCFVVCNFSFLTIVHQKFHSHSHSYWNLSLSLHSSTSYLGWGSQQCYHSTAPVPRRHHAALSFSASHGDSATRSLHHHRVTYSSNATLSPLLSTLSQGHTLRVK